MLLEMKRKKVGEVREMKGGELRQERKRGAND